MIRGFPEQDFALAAFADTHVTVSKEQKGGRTLMRTGVVKRRGERLREISRMPGDAGVRNASLKMAQQFVSDAAQAAEVS